MKKQSVDKEENYSQWYNQLTINSGLADYSAVRGCMIIKPYGFAIWEMLEKILDGKLKETGHSNAYFPLLIPKSFISKEAAHIEGFAKECAVVTHYRLKHDDNNKIVLDDTAKLEEELIIRPTSETIIWDTYRSWINSYRDLPILVNQWANVVRWEMRPRLFLRTAEFLWQEGHTAHATEKEAVEEAKTMILLYEEFLKNYLAIPVIFGIKTESERFAGAVETYCIEALMGDGKALQAGTSHFLGQNFAKAFDVKYTTKQGKKEYVWATSWAVSSRLMGALIMVHSDDRGLILPPKLAPIQVVIVPVYKTDEEKNQIDLMADGLTDKLKIKNILYKYDDRDYQRPGFKFSEWELKGVPLRITIGARDLENKTVELARRFDGFKQTISFDDADSIIYNELDDINAKMYTKALSYQAKHTTEVFSYDDFKENLEKIGGFISCLWDGSRETEEMIKEQTKATIRCIPLDSEVSDEDRCIFSGKPAKYKVLFAKSY